MHKSIQHLLALLCAAFLNTALLADVVETKNGAKLVGKITKIDSGAITLSTTYAGDLAIKQTEVASIATDAPIAVRLASGTRIDGKVSTTDGIIQVASKDGTVSTSIDKVAASWAAGGEDPQIVAMRRHWTFQTSADVVGKQGNTKSTGIGLGFVAALVSPQDALKFYGAYDYATTTSATGVKTKSADATKGGVDYSSFFSEKYGWFVRSELGKDSVAAINLRSTTDAGGTYRLIKNTSQSLVGRLGAGYRFESYSVGPNNQGAVLSTGLSHSYAFSNYTSIVTDLQYLPAFKNFADYRFLHDSALELPLGPDFWKLRLGVNNQYTSKPVLLREKLDTTYYTRLLLNWK
ncbi:MAG: DUF481 domain-containing protein [Opitutae bacterium]|nr:DUF481 domain-containing protein [Opitutae bacterium]